MKVGAKEICEALLHTQEIVMPNILEEHPSTRSFSKVNCFHSNSGWISQDLGKAGVGEGAWHLDGVIAPSCDDDVVLDLGAVQLMGVLRHPLQQRWVALHGQAVLLRMHHLQPIAPVFFLGGFLRYTPQQ